MATGRGGDPGAGETLRGVFLIVVAGLVLGGSFNALGLASRPPHGLAWVAAADTTRSLEALQAATLTAIVDSVPPAAGVIPPQEVRTAAEPPPPSLSAPSSRRPSAEPSGPAALSEGRPSAQAPDGASAAPAPTVTATRPARVSRPPALTPVPAAPPPVIPDVPGPLTVELATLKRLYDADAVMVIDARAADEYAAGHIAGALNLPYNDALAEPARVARLDPRGRPIVVYCDGGTCELSMDLAKLLVESGKRRVLVYERGIAGWEAAGYALAHGPEPGARP
ncbi:MAG: hypothetical protein A2W00_03995 [Candidatus Eisenbacteria bacterium RBG_16_71_46]|nr:MAG: hypothetical protein A2W00_03995 [Candidatus Eisenbacteria bacterium RBG_16_71_46]